MTRKRKDSTTWQLNHVVLSYFLERAAKILREEGPVEFSRRVLKASLRRTTPSRSQWVRLNSHKNGVINAYSYRKPADPFDTIRINPNSVDQVIRSVDVTDGLGQVRGGDWDERPESFKHVRDSPHVVGFRQRFRDGLEWENTAYYKSLAGKYDEEYLKKRVKRYEQLFYDIKQNGYVEGHAGHMPANLARDESLERKRKVRFYDRLEVLVVIDRDGDISLKSGRHRFSIARVLGIEIPVHVVRRHEEWQKLRDEIHDRGLPEEREKELRDHPDTQDVLG